VIRAGRAKVYGVPARIAVTPSPPSGVSRRGTVLTRYVTSVRGGSQRFPLYLQIFAALALGLVLGPLLGKQAAPLGELGRLVVQLIKAAATPLLFFAIVNAVLKAEVAGKGALRMLVAACLNASLALAVGLTVSNLIRPGEHLRDLSSAAGAPLANTYADKKIDFLATLASYVPADIVSPFSQNLAISIILIALLAGFGLRRVRSEELAEGRAASGIEAAVGSLLRLCEVVLSWITRLIPLAVFGVVCKSVGEYGYAPLRGLGLYVGSGLLGFAIQVFLIYSAWLAVLRVPWRRFWREAREPVIYALGANSSLATLPITLRALDRLGVSRGASALGACVGTNLNNDGIILYEGMALLLVAQASGFDLSLGQQLVAAGVCMFAAMGVAGVPEAGFISLALVLNTLRLPVEILPLLLTVDWILARCRSAVNVLSDMLLSLIVDGRRVEPPPV
jgi:Na+/H+-dicarboxylate symporter